MAIEPDVDRWNHGGPPDPDRLMHVLAEAWPLAADTAGIWLLTRDWPLMTDPLAADGDPHADLELELVRAQMFADTRLLHQTSSRIDGGAVVLTYMAVIGCDGPVRSRWPDALPVSRAAALVVGKPPTHGAAEPPTVRHWDVVLHGLRHLAFQLGSSGDAELAAALDENWRRHLAEWEPVLYQMYSDRHTA